MFLKPNRKRQLETIACFIAFALTVAYFLNQVFVVRSYLLEYVDYRPALIHLHMFLAIYLFINVAGNMCLIILINCRVKSHHGSGRYCEHCKQNQPADSWHCTACNACILGRDHHCIFLAHCIGRKNLRYFTCFFCHLAVSMVCATYYNYLVVKSVFDLKSYAKITSRLLDPCDWAFVLDSPSDIKKRLCVFFWFVTLIFLPFSLNYGVFHLYKTARGLTWHEYRKGKIPACTHWKRNLSYFLGSRWYYAMFWPFVDSPLPDKRTSEVVEGYV